MPRGPRLDAPGALHHVMARGIEKRDIFLDDRDRESFLNRLARLVEARALEVYAWVLMPNHFHLLVRTLCESLSRSMRRLLTGHAVRFNQRHHRVGHLFQNRYRSIVCEEESYFLELVRYIHLNPLRRGIVRSLDELAIYPYSGHAALMGRESCPWQATAKVLRRFGTSPTKARLAYREFVHSEVGSQPKTDLDGGGLIRSAGGWVAVKQLRRGREVFESDERILGGGDFVKTVLREVASDRDPVRPGLTEIDLDELILGVQQALDLADSRGWLRAKTSRGCCARDGIAFLWIHRLGRSGKALARALDINPANIYRAAERGRRTAKRWDGVLERIATNRTNVP